MPDATLKDQSGNEHSLRQSLGKPLTVVVFWNADNPYSLDQFEEIPNELAPFKELGVTAIAVHVGQVPDNYGELVERYGQDILCLADPDRAYYQKVAGGPVPRTYVLDIEGKVIWLDIEYSRTTRYDLRNALHYSLQNGQEADEPESE
jgi:peroxiredoxin